MRIQIRYRSLALFVVLLSLAGGLVWPAQAFAVDIPTRAGHQYLEVRQADGSYTPFYVKGMNMSVALPGKHPSEFPQDEELYYEWLCQVSEMNCNCVRVYTILPPKFYNALYRHNQDHPNQALWLIQGVWATPPPEYNYLDEDYMAEVEMNIRHAVDLVHGNAEFPDRPGWTGGRYQKNVSPWLLAWLLGREWEPDDIEGFHELRPDYTTYQGQRISCYQGQPIECWFARICDYAVTYEEDKYGVQHPTTFSSWPPTDPLSHDTESNIEDEEEYAGFIAEGRVDVFSNDAVNISSKNFTAEPEFIAGLYASYHVYAYWPDFIDNEPEYAEAMDRYGPSNYYGYLVDLKSFYDDRPLVIAEYGLPNGPLPAHLQHQGWNHGGLSEEEVAESLPRLTQAIRDSGCAGGIVFSWMDEWFKKVWLWAEFYDPWMDRPLWFNFYDPEENYGMIAYHPGENGPTSSLSANAAEWEEASIRPGSSVAVAEDAPRIETVAMMHDEGYLYVKVQLADFSDWEFDEHALHLGFDVLGDELGNTAWPGPLHLNSDRGMETTVSFAAGQARLRHTESFRFWEPYRVPYSIKPRIAEVIPHILEAEANAWAWFEPRVETNRRRVGRTGQVFEARTCSLNPLPRGSLIPGPQYSDQAMWNVNADAGVLELRMPWILLGFVGPHQMRVLQSNEDGTNGSVVSEGVGLSAVLASATGHIAAAWPGLDGDTVQTSVSERYAWEEWTVETITYHHRLKPVYYSMQEALGGIEQTTPLTSW